MNFAVVFLIFSTVCDCFVSNRKYFDIATQLPEIIINNKPKNEYNGYQYPIPVFPPIFLDESTTKLYPTHEPPSFDFPQVNISNDFSDYPAYLPPTVTLQPPFFNPPPVNDDDDTVVIPLPPSNEYLPPLHEHIPPANDYLPPHQLPNSHLNPAQLKIFNMSCLNSPNQRYFRAIIRVPHRTDLVPVLDDAAADCLTGSNNVYRLDFTEEKMKHCGVKYCSNKDQVNMCIGIRIPTVRGLRMLEDTSLTLQCKPQERIVSHIKHMRFNAQSLQGRSATNIARGGYQPNFETEVELFRRSPDGTNKFSRLVNSGTVVQLGEELLLRAAVKDGDGWKFSRLGEVIVHHVPKNSKADSRSVILVDNTGCRDVRMRSVCPDNPIQQNPLVTTLTVKAFMFQGMDNGDEMIMSVRMIGCLLPEDCLKGRSCEENRTRNRIRRSVSSNITNWQSFLEFKVAVPESESYMPDAEAFNNVIFLTVFVILLLLLGVILLVYCKLRK